MGKIVVIGRGIAAAFLCCILLAACTQEEGLLSEYNDMEKLDRGNWYAVGFIEDGRRRIMALFCLKEKQRIFRVTLYNYYSTPLAARRIAVKRRLKLPPRKALRIGAMPFRCSVETTEALFTS